MSELEEARAALHLAPSPYGEAALFELTGRVHHSLGRLDAAYSCYLTALEVFTGVDEVSHARVRARLAQLAASAAGDRASSGRVLVGGR